MGEGEISGEGLRVLPYATTRVNFGETSPLPEPRNNRFGTWNEIKDFAVGATLTDTINKDGMISAGVTGPTGEQRTIGIGRTPQADDPSQGGDLLPNAGDRGEYLLSVYTTKPGAEPTRTFRYLDPSNIDNVVIKIGPDGITLNPNTQRPNPIVIKGTVEAVSALRR